MDKPHVANKKTINGLSLPYNIFCENTSSIISCNEIIRQVPGKRLVTYGKFDEHDVVIKIFFSRHAYKHFKRELSGIKLLQDSKIPTPMLYYHGRSVDKKMYVLVFERLFDADTLKSHWQDQKYNVREALELMEKAILELATQHVLGVIQKDLHLDNFLISRNILYTLDAAAIERSPFPLSKSESLNNLGLFLSQLGVGQEELQQKLFMTYADARGWIVTKRDVSQLENSIRYWNRKRCEEHHKKVFRNSSLFKKIKLFSKRIHYNKKYQQEGFQGLVFNPEKIFKCENLTILKAGRTSTVVKFNLDGKDLVVKRYNVKNPWHFIRRCLRKSRAMRNWALANRLQLMGIETPTPVACIEERFLGLRTRSYFLMEYAEGNNAQDFFTSAPDSEVEKVAEKLLNLLKQLRLLRLSHGDMKITNILIKNSIPVLLDLDGMKEHGSNFSLERAYRKDLKRLLKNWDLYPRVKKIFNKITATGG